MPAGWQRARLTPLVGARSAAVALQAITGRDASVPDPFAALVPYLHAADFAAFEDAGHRQRTARATLAAMAQEQLMRFDSAVDASASDAPRQSACKAACKKILGSSWPDVHAVRAEAGLESTLEQECTERCDPELMEFGSSVEVWLEVVAETSAVIQGPLRSPTAVMREVSELVGERDPFRRRHRDLIAYEDGLATAALTVIDDAGYDTTRPVAVIVHLLDWRHAAKDTPPELAHVTIFALDFDQRATQLEMAVFGGRSS